MAGNTTKRHRAYRNGGSREENRDKRMKGIVKKLSRNNPEKIYKIVDKTVKGKSGNLIIKNIIISNKEQLKPELSNKKEA